MSSDSDGPKEGNSEFLFMAQDGSQNEHETSKATDRENSIFEEGDVNDELENYEFENEDAKVDLEGEIISALEELEIERKKNRKSRNKIEELSVQVEDAKLIKQYL